MLMYQHAKSRPEPPEVPSTMILTGPFHHQTPMPGPCPAIGPPVLPVGRAPVPRQPALIDLGDTCEAEDPESALPERWRWFSRTASGPRPIKLAICPMTCPTDLPSTTADCSCCSTNTLRAPTAASRFVASKTSVSSLRIAMKVSGVLLGRAGEEKPLALG